VSTLEEGQGHLKEPSLDSFEFEFLAALRHRAACAELCLVLPTFGLLSNHNPSPTFRTGDARARNAISHSKIILRFEQSIVDGTGIGRKSATFLGLGNSVAVGTLGGGPVIPLAVRHGGLNTCQPRKVASDKGLAYIENRRPAIGAFDGNSVPV
jgi:hypothetical protein